MKEISNTEIPVCFGDFRVVLEQQQTLIGIISVSSFFSVGLQRFQCERKSMKYLIF